MVDDRRNDATPGPAGRPTVSWLSPASAACLLLCLLLDVTLALSLSLTSTSLFSPPNPLSHPPQQNIPCPYRRYCTSRAVPHTCIAVTFPPLPVLYPRICLSCAGQHNLRCLACFACLRFHPPAPVVSAYVISPEKTWLLLRVGRSARSRRYHHGGISLGSRRGQPTHNIHAHHGVVIILPEEQS